MTEQRRSDGLSTSGLRAGVHLALVCALSFAVLRIFQTPGHAALFWPANGVMTALLLPAGIVASFVEVALRRDAAFSILLLD